MERHAITKAEMQAIKVAHVMASEAGAGRLKRLMFTYDVGRKRLEYMVFSFDGGEYPFDDLDQAIAAYNEL